MYWEFLSRNLVLRFTVIVNMHVNITLVVYRIVGKLGELTLFEPLAKESLAN